MFPIGHPFANKNTRLFLCGKVAKRLLAEAQEAFPCEYSALLAGRGNTITQHVPLRAHSSTPRRFQWDGASLIEALRSIERNGLEWLGVLHTHPHTPPLPSPADVREWHYPQLSYWVLSLSGPPDLRVYQWQEEGFRERCWTRITRD